MIPSGATSSVASTSTISFLEGKERAVAIRRLYADYDVKLNPSCDMARRISAAIEVSDKWLLNKTKEIQTGTLVRGIQMDKIATSLLAARNSKKIREYLRHLTSGSLDVYNRRPSRAKSALWELELHALLLRQSLRQENAKFLRRHDRYFRKYLSSGRLTGVMVAGGGIAHVGKSFQSARQFTTWAMPNLEQAKAKLLEISQSRLQSGWRA